MTAQSPLVPGSTRFELGRIVITPNALATLPANDVRDALRRHASGDWGDIDEDDRAENELSINLGCRLFSVYHVKNSAKFWIITEADRSSTCVLLPEDY